MKKLVIICFAVLLIAAIFASCADMPPAATSDPNSSDGERNSPSVLPNETDTSSEVSKLVFAEDDTTEAMFHIGMTREEVKQSLEDNQLEIQPSVYGSSEEFVLMSSGGFITTDGISVMYDTVTDLLCQVAIFPVSETELCSSYASQKGLKIGDTVERLLELYGEPYTIYEDDNPYNPFVAYYYILPINLDDYFNEIAKVPRKPNPDASDFFLEAGKAYLRVNISKIEGDNYNKITSIVYEAW